MRFTSLVIELIRARPRLIVWIAVLLQAAMWLFVALVFYRSPPGSLATVLAFGREYQVGTDLGPPLPVWLADIAYRAAGGHVFGVYVLAELCGIATFITLYHLSRAVVGPQQAVLAVLLTMTVLAFSSAALDFGPLVLARPLWALLLLHSWQIIGQRRSTAWFAWSIEAGLLLLTTPAAIFLLPLLIVFALATAGGRRTLRAFDPLFALVVVAVLALPYAVWMMRAEALVLPALPEVAELNARALHAVWLLGGLLLGAAAIPALTVLNTAPFVPKSEEAPIIYRPPVEPLARNFVYFFALAPALGAVLISGLLGLDTVVGGAGVVLVMSGLAVVVVAGDLIAMRRAKMLRMVWAAAVVAPAIGVVLAVLFLPWTGANEIATSMPARAISDFFDESFARRTNHRLRAVAGETQLASLITLHSGRPHLFIDAEPARTPWMNQAKFSETGGVVVWRASDTAGTPPPDILARFPGIVPEVPRAFEWLVTGRQQLLRIGWAIVRPKGT
ncbi:glycosyltransferase family 39 protein [Bradyrhizobium sp. SSUT18]|uniref:glycosyltransferase family 39 protein n=1 Tax=unclassified Bradyrhizobium TaxID=2631580 RepID=UPI00244B565F|nr:MULTISPECIES: glycosyltransferase family 39 protein [unclassified Bradyrhizobium]MDH2355092.1 glycosyltransferase family 39 protein [Bradyrhizobium sp. SSUT112]MDH2404018.1 glycosyltransferase family 39 protein [Bradyrhizobium sp. SSUT18]